MTPKANQDETPKAKTRGRPPGTYKYKDGPTYVHPHRMTQKGHDWILQNKDWIETQARR